MSDLLTKVAKGIQYGDVSNIAVRNILTGISKSISGGFTEQEMYDTLDYFDWRCPYTDKDLRPLIENKLGGYATDHIYPQNKDWCGLNVKGNLVIVDKEANARKRQQDVETFLLNDTSVLGDLDMPTRQARLQKIKDFQKLCGYDPEQIRDVVGPLMAKRYDALRAEQEACIDDTLEELKSIQVYALPRRAAAPKSSSPRKWLPELVFCPADEEQFKQELVRSKKAHFVLTYASGATKTTPWKADSFEHTSNLRANIQSRPFWRNKDNEGLVKVEVILD